MTLMLKRGLWLWAGMLGLTLLAIVPLAAGLRTTAVVIVALGVALAWFRAGRQQAQQNQLMGDTALPPAGYRQPVVLVCGDGLASLFGAVATEQLAVRVTGQGCYLRVAGLAQLPTVVAGIQAIRPGWCGQLSVIFVVNPGEHTDDGLLANQLRALCHQVALVRRRGVALPLMLLSYIQAAKAAGTWFSWDAGQANPNVCEGGACVSLADWQRQSAGSAIHANRVQACVQLNSAAAWLEETLGAHLSTRNGRNPVGLATVCAITLVPSLPEAVSGNVWQQWLREKVALVAAGPTLSSLDTSLPLPDALLHLLPVAAQRSAASRAIVIALWLFTLAGLIALLSSAWQNTMLIRQVTDDLLRYSSIAQPTHRDQPAFALREQALTVLRKHAGRLESYDRHGEPLALGLGLYRGEPLRLKLREVLTLHRSPMPASVPSAGPMRLDSLSLFSTGSAQLKPHSTKLLINALVGIKAQPGWLIVITGHTDVTGNPSQNLQLSRDRAAAVRDWMQSMGEIPDSCFAVQGFGASQPIASNDNEAGRMANRRVDIRLVPEVGACVLLTTGPGKQHPSHPAAFKD